MCPLGVLWTETTIGLAKAKLYFHGYIQVLWKAHRNSSMNLRGSLLIREVDKLFIIQANSIPNSLMLIQTNSLSNWYDVIKAQYASC